jgi:hypothetical protein
MSETRIGEFITVLREGAVAIVTVDRGDGRNAMSRTADPRSHRNRTELRE